MILSKNSRHTTAMATEAANSNHIIQIYAFLHGCRDALVCLKPMKAAERPKMLAIPNAVLAKIISDRLTGCMV